MSKVTQQFKQILSKISDWDGLYVNDVMPALDDLNSIVDSLSDEVPDYSVYVEEAFNKAQVAKWPEGLGDLDFVTVDTDGHYIYHDGRQYCFGRFHNYQGEMLSYDLRLFVGRSKVFGTQHYSELQWQFTKSRRPLGLFVTPMVAT